MNVLVVGQGGREHALAWKLSKSKRVSKIFAAPGNGGTANEAKCFNKSINDMKGIEFQLYAFNKSRAA